MLSRDHLKALVSTPPQPVPLSPHQALDRLMAMPARASVLAMVGIGTAHRPLIPDAIDTLKRWRDALDLNVWVIPFDRALQRCYCLDRPFGMSEGFLEALPPPKAAVVSESVTDCLNGALMHARQAMGRSPDHVVAMSTQGGMMGVPMRLKELPHAPLFTSLPSDVMAVTNPTPTVDTVPRERLRAACEVLIEQRALIQAMDETLVARARVRL